jgi:hypothetical protein
MRASMLIVVNQQGPNMRQIEEFVKKKAAKVLEARGVNIETLLLQSLGRVLKAENEKGIPLIHADHHYSHIMDWLASAVVNRELWLERVNAEGVPLKLAKFGTFQQIVDEADKAMRKNNTRGVTGGKVGEVVHTFGDGWTMVRLRSGEELDHESAQMQHCVGHGGYDEAVLRGSTGIYSLRDPGGKSHATIEMEHGVGGDIIEQIKGKQNKVPRRDYFARVVAWLETLEDYSYPLGLKDHPSGWAINNTFQLVNLASLEPGSKFTGNVECNLLDEDSGDNQDERPAELELPPNLTINGNLTVKGMWEHRVVLPVGLRITGDIILNGVTVDMGAVPGRAAYISDCFVKRLPRRMEQAVSIARSTFDEAFDAGAGTVFAGFVSLSNSKLETALNAMSFETDLELDQIQGWIGCDGHPCLKVPGDLKVSRSALKFFRDVKVGGSFQLNQTTVFQSPDSLYVGKNFHIHRSEIHNLPDDMTVERTLEVTDNSTLQKVPLKAVLNGDIVFRQTRISLDGRTAFNGNLVMVGSNLNSLAPHMRVAGDMTIDDCDVGTLPRGLTVGGSFTFKGSLPNRLPPDIRIGENLNLEGSLVASLPPKMNIPGDLNIRHLRRFSIPEGVTIGGALLAEWSGITRLPADLKVRDVMAFNSFLEELPENFSIEGDLNLNTTAICLLPDNLYVGGNADLRGSEIIEIPASATIEGDVLMDPEVADMRFARIEDANAGTRYRAGSRIP